MLADRILQLYLYMTFVLSRSSIFPYVNCNCLPFSVDGFEEFNMTQRKYIQNDLYLKEYMEYNFMHSALPVLIIQYYFQEICMHCENETRTSSMYEVYAWKIDKFNHQTTIPYVELI